MCAPSSHTRRPLAREHTSRCFPLRPRSSRDLRSGAGSGEPTPAGVLSRARTDRYECSLRPSIVWCSRPRISTALLEGALMAKILIVEDDDVIARGMSEHLKAAGFDPIAVGAGEVGLARLRYENPDVCVLDLMLPGVDGWRLIEAARSEGIGTPILVVSARGTEHDRVHALEIGADDYLVKPFSMKELVARVKAAVRRGVRAQDTPRGDA